MKVAVHIVTHNCDITVEELTSECVFFLMLKAENLTVLVFHELLLEWLPKAVLSWTKHAASSICPALLSSVLSKAYFTNSPSFAVYSHNYCASSIYCSFVTVAVAQKVQSFK